jgi:nitrilase
MGKFKAAVVQAEPVGGDTQATVVKATNLITECGRSGAQVAVFPEAFVGGYPKGASFNIFLGGRTPEGREEFKCYYDQAINVPGPETVSIGQAVKAAKIFLTLGVIERDQGTLYCTALLFGPQGDLLAKRRKLMPTAAERLCWGFGDGSTLNVVDTPWGVMGPVICWENYMPLLRMAMYGKGIGIYCAPTVDDRPGWSSTMQHIALEGRCFVLSANQFLTRRNFPDYLKNRISDDHDHVLIRGGSMIVGPLGEILAGPVFDQETILCAELDTDDIVRAKFDFDVVGHYARPDVFKLLVDVLPSTPARLDSGPNASLY